MNILNQAREQRAQGQNTSVHHISRFNTHRLSDCLISIHRYRGVGIPLSPLSRVPDTVDSEKNIVLGVEYLGDSGEGVCLHRPGRKN